MNRKIALAAVLILSAPAALSAQSAPVIPSVELSSRAARQMVDVCLTLAEKNGWKMQVAVVDRGGDLIAFGRSDGAMAGARDIAIAKARTSGTMGWSTETFARIAWGKEGTTPGALSAAPGLIGVPGGLPVTRGKDGHLGGVGVSGGIPAQDVACATEALASLAR